ncbi:MAG TPA: TolC family protein [Haliangium sp.]|nr:TolC family protein [Haliangium sp.]
MAAAVITAALAAGGAGLALAQPGAPPGGQPGGQPETQPAAQPGAGTGTQPVTQPAAPETGPGTRIDLEQAIALALARSERARIAEQSAVAAEARVARARAFFFPEVSLSGSYTPWAGEFRGGEHALQSSNRLQAALSLGVTIFDARSRPLYRQARLDSEAARFEALDDKRLIAFDAAAAYVATLGLEQVVAAAERRVELARQNTADARGRVEAQLTSSNDLTRIELELAAAERELTRARAELDTGYLQLGYLLDEGIAGPLEPPEALLAEAAAPPAEAATLIAEARTRRLDIAAGFKRTEALQAFAAEPDARLWPRLELQGQLGATNESAFGDPSADWLVGVTLSWVLWDGGVRAAERRERRATATSAELGTRAVVRQVARDVGSALVALRRSQATVQQSEAVVAAARRNADESAILYREGLARAIEVADASARLFDAEVALARERYGLALALLDLRAALGLDPLGKEMTR